MIITILGKSGFKSECKEDEYGDCKKFEEIDNPRYNLENLNLEKTEGSYRNSLVMLLNNYPDDEFHFIGTQKAIDVQEEVIQQEFKCSLKSKGKIYEITEQNFDKIFEHTYKLLDSVNKNEKVILDITHGLRSQPFISLFAATISKFIKEINLEVIFAAENGTVNDIDLYQYHTLNTYIELSQISLMLMNFQQTLNFKSSTHTKLKSFNVEPFAKFSEALMSNNIPKLEEAYPKLKEELNRARNDKKLKHLSKLYDEIKEELSIFESFETLEYHNKYIKLANLMCEKGYILISITYAFEGLREYVRYSFERNGLVHPDNNLYKQNQAVVNYIVNCYKKKAKLEYLCKNYFYQNFGKSIYVNNIDSLSKVAVVYQKIRGIRNTLTHVNYNHNKQINQFKSQLKEITQIIENDILKTIKK